MTRSNRLISENEAQYNFHGLVSFILENLECPVILFDSENRVETMNRIAGRLFFSSAADSTGIKGKDINNIIPGWLRQKINRFSKSKSHKASFEKRISGNEKNHYYAVELLRLEVTTGIRSGILAIFKDITHYKQSLTRCKKEKNQDRIYLDKTGAMIAVFDRLGRILRFNNTCERITGYSRKGVLGKKFDDIFPAPGNEVYIDKVIDQLLNDKIFKNETCCPARDGEQRIISWTYTAPFNGAGELEYIIGAGYDITEHKKLEEKVSYLDKFDPLTGLFNRNFFEQQMLHLEKQEKHETVNPVTIILCDVDGLKLVNDTDGHFTGDATLMLAAGLLKQCFDQDTLMARVGGDEFAVLLPNCNEQKAEFHCHEIRESIKEYNRNNPGLPLSMSVGYAVSNTFPIRMFELYREADNSMYREKLHRSKSARSAIVQTLMKALEARDYITEGHADRLRDLVTQMARNLGLPEQKIADLRILAQFHDIGKVGIPDRILFKKGPLTPREFTEMQHHCEIGYRIAKAAPILAPIADWILKHHEWWNGQGYPLGLKGEDIPLECRILAIADAYDAMTSNRPYRKALSHDEALGELKKNAGIQFDPELVQKFIELFDSNHGGFSKCVFETTGQTQSPEV